MDLDKLYLEIHRANCKGKQHLHITEEDGTEVDVEIPYIDPALCDQAL
tara:strand:+ start:796 stop:939 length:144 start_codon:yes stop_codon:yes gene_type:complete